MCDKVIRRLAVCIAVLLRIGSENKLIMSEIKFILTWSPKMLIPRRHWLLTRWLSWERPLERASMISFGMIFEAKCKQLNAVRDIIE